MVIFPTNSLWMFMGPHICHTHPDAIVCFQIDPNKFASVSVVQRREDGHSVTLTHLEESRSS